MDAKIQLEHHQIVRFVGSLAHREHIEADGKIVPTGTLGKVIRDNDHSESVNIGWVEVMITHVPSGRGSDVSYGDKVKVDQKYLEEA